MKHASIKVQTNITFLHLSTGTTELDDPTISIFRELVNLASLKTIKDVSRENKYMIILDQIVYKYINMRVHIHT